MKTKARKIGMMVERTRTGYSAFAEQYPVYTTGKTLAELKARMIEALGLYFRKEGRAITASDLKVTLDLQQFFEFYKVINAKALSERIGMNQSLLAQYINGHKKPSARQVGRILEGVREVGKELTAISFLIGNT